MRLIRRYTDLIRFWTRLLKAPELLLCSTVSTTSLRDACRFYNSSVDLAQEKAREMSQTYIGEYVPKDAILQSIARQFRANQQSESLKVDKRSILEKEKRLAREEAQRRESQKVANQYRRQTATETVDEKEAERVLHGQNHRSISLWQRSHGASDWPNYY